MEIITSLITFLESSKYFLLFLGSFSEGAIVMMTGGLLWHSGYMEFWPMYFSLLAGDFLSDLMWYALGYTGARRVINRWGHLINVTPAVLEKVEERFKRYHIAILIISKLTNGFGFAVATLMVAGMLRVPFLTYCLISFFGGMVWIYLMIVAGDYLGHFLALIPPGFRVASAIGVLILAGLILRYINGRLAKVK